MAGERTLPGLALTGFWDEGSNGWKDAMDANLRALSTLVQLGVISRTTSLPGSPTDGDIYIIPSGDADAGEIAVRDNGAWVNLAPVEGWRAWVKDDDETVVYDGSAWAAASGGGLADAPSDGGTYGRKDGAWALAGGGGALPFRGARIAPTALQNYTNLSTYDTVRFAVAERDTSGFWSAGSPNRLTIPAGVTKVRLSANVKGDTSDAVDNNNIVFVKNGSVNDTPGIASVDMQIDGYSNSGAYLASDVLDVVQSDYFELRYFASASFSLNAERGQTWFAIEVIEGGGASTEMVELLDVDPTGLADGDVLIWNAATSKFEPGTPLATVSSGAVHKPFRGAMVKFTADESLSNGPLSWDATEYDTNSFWSAGSPALFTIPAGVLKVRLTANMALDSNLAAESSTMLRFLKDGSSFLGGSNSGGQSGYSNIGVSVTSAVIAVAQGDTFSVEWYSTDGSVTGVDGQCFFAIEVMEAEVTLP